MNKDELGAQAKKTLESLNEIMDHVAALPDLSLPSSPDRDALWRVASLLRRYVIYTNHLSDPWPVAPWSCMRLTKLGRKCGNARKEGHVACHQHEDQADFAILRAWQDAVHYPYRRVNTPPAPLEPWFKWEVKEQEIQEDIVPGVYAMLKELS